MRTQTTDQPEIQVKARITTRKTISSTLYQQNQVLKSEKKVDLFFLIVEALFYMVVTRGVPNLKLWGGNEASFLLALHSRQKGNPSAFPTTIH
jgi:uncharacterized membrane protein YagU involved in acid resistance